MSWTAEEVALAVRHTANSPELRDAPDYLDDMEAAVALAEYLRSLFDMEPTTLPAPDTPHSITAALIAGALVRIREGGAGTAGITLPGGVPAVVAALSNDGDLLPTWVLVVGSRDDSGQRYLVLHGWSPAAWVVAGEDPDTVPDPAYEPQSAVLPLTSALRALDAYRGREAFYAEPVVFLWESAIRAMPGRWNPNTPAGRRAEERPPDPFVDAAPREGPSKPPPPPEPDEPEPGSLFDAIRYALKGS